MKKQIFRNTAYFIFALVALFGVGVFAEWSEPVGDALTLNLPVPIHEGFDQVKGEGLSVEAFIANKNAAFLQDTILYGVLRGATANDTNSMVSFGGTGTDAGQTTYQTSLVVNGKTSAVGTITQGMVANPEGKHLCADTVGTIVTCDFAGGPGDDECPVGQVHDYTGNCNYTVDIDSPYPGMTITAVSGIAGFDFDETKPVGNPMNGFAQRQEGLHDEFNGTISITISGPSGGFVSDGNLYVSKSGYKVSCFDLPLGKPSQTYTTSITQYSVQDRIDISGNSGKCP